MSTPDITTVPGFRTDMTAEERVQLMSRLTPYIRLTSQGVSGTHCVRAGVEYEILKDPETGLLFVFADRVKISQTQTEAAARLVIRNHARANNPAPRDGMVF